MSAVPRRGYIVAPITLQSVRELFDLRLLLEPAAAALAAGNVDAAHLRALDAICAAGYVPGDKSSERKFLSANKALHLAVASASGNQRLAQALALILEEMNRFFHFGLALRDRSDEMEHEHSALVEALIAGDRELARATAVDQIEAARRMVVEALLSSAALDQAEITLG